MSSIMDDHFKSGYSLGGDHYCHYQYWTKDEKVIGLPAGTLPPDGSVFIGIHEHHRREDGSWCGGYVQFENVPEAHFADVKYGTQSRHMLVSESPLTIAPSLACRTCPSHGFVRDGKWVDA